MKRKEFKQLIKIMSTWKVDKRMGNYRLPDGSPLCSHLYEVAANQLKLNGLAIDSKGNVNKVFFNSLKLTSLTEKCIEFMFIDEKTSVIEQQHRLSKVIHEMIF